MSRTMESEMNKQRCCNKRPAFLVLMILAVLMISCCVISSEEILRVPSPDGRVEAVLIQRNGGATTSFLYELYIVPVMTKNQVDSKFAMLRMDHTKDVSIKWRQNNLLVIQYTEARIFNFSNFWQSRLIDDFKYVVELKLEPLSDGSALSEQDRGNW